ncbi:hypothetical protein [Francisella salimarina]|uniref:hypothetical protein n=1 Tax=Francisella salimarina TaxID=2599927 RepID=UPI00399163A1
MRSQKKIQMPDTLVILFCIAILVAITSYFIPVGKFDVKKNPILFRWPNIF